MKRLFSRLILLSCVVLLPSCSGDDSAHKHKTFSVLYSPNGEPLNGGALGTPSCEQALSGWFARVDMKHNEAIDRVEFTADAKQQFARMDIDHNGYLVSEELDRYRAPYWQNVQHAEQHSEPEAARTELHKHKKPQNSHSASDSAETSLLADPVMAADTNLDFKVTEDEFLLRSQVNFDELDHNHNGTLEKQEILAVCHDSDKP